MSNCYLVSLVFFIKLAPMVLFLACVAWDCPMPMGSQFPHHSKRLSGMIKALR